VAQRGLRPQPKEPGTWNPETAEDDDEDEDENGKSRWDGQYPCPVHASKLEERSTERNPPKILTARKEVQRLWHKGEELAEVCLQLRNAC
jgi:hypothetical protein